ncbi:MAG TPA: signal peptide peptidase SppA [Verrucomicrobiae bacterium]|nr:signal peptide peptidase SppA [Verrucomicrobiae bacterium]
MSSNRSLLGRLFGGLFALVGFVYKLIVIGFVLLIVGGIWLALQGGPAPTLEDNVALVIYPTGELVETTDQDATQRFIEDFVGDAPAQTSLRSLTEALERGATDARISLAVLKLDAMWGGGAAQQQELAAAVKAFRASGKPVFAYGPYFEQSHYHVAAQADHVSLDPMGMVFVEGYDAYQSYFKEALDKLGVDVHVFRVGEYKSAVEPFERNDMSPEAREANREWLGDLWASYNRDVGSSRQLPETAMHDYAVGLAAALKQSGGNAAAVAKERKLVDAVETLAEFRKRVAEKVGWDDDSGTFRQVHHREYLRVIEHEHRMQAQADKAIAVVVVQGDIVDGDSEPGMAGAETIADLLTDARLDDEIAAVVLRVDSPGGSVFASERIRREVRNVQAAGKPVVASMSNVAASGGYWVSMDADEIWAHDSTITGSIGIFGLVPTFDKPLAKLGIHSDGIGTTPLAGAFRPDRPLSPDVAVLIQSQIEQGYKLFVEGVVAGRELPEEKVREIARGRVWSGADAAALGLVDQLGGYNEAIAAAVRLAGLDAGAYRVEELKDEREFPLQRFLDVSGHARLSVLKSWLGPLAALTPVERIAQNLLWLRDPRGVYAYCFCTPSAGSITRGSLR